MRSPRSQQQWQNQLVAELKQKLKKAEDSLRVMTDEGNRKNLEM